MRTGIVAGVGVFVMVVVTMAQTAPLSGSGGGAGGVADAGSTISAEFVTEQLILIATAVGAVAALPPLIEFLIDRRKRREQIALSLDDERVADLRIRLAGLDGLLADIADLIDRAKEPSRYAALSLGNEMLIVGPTLSGKKSLARRIAIDAKMDRILTVYNPRNADALAKAKSIVGRVTDEKIVLLLPSIDQVFDGGNEELLAELDALIESTAGRHNVLVLGTARGLLPDSPLDSTFGTKILMPGAVRGVAAVRRTTPEGRAMLSEVAKFYLKDSQRLGFGLEKMSDEEFVQRLLSVAGNPAEIEDIVVLCETASIHAARETGLGGHGGAAGYAITNEILERAISRVTVNVRQDVPED